MVGYNEYDRLVDNVIETHVEGCIGHVNCTCTREQVIELVRERYGEKGLDVLRDSEGFDPDLK